MKKDMARGAALATGVGPMFWSFCFLTSYIRVLIQQPPFLAYKQA